VRSPRVPTLGSPHRLAPAGPSPGSLGRSQLLRYSPFLSTQCAVEGEGRRGVVSICTAPSEDWLEAGVSPQALSTQAHGFGCVELWVDPEPLPAQPRCLVHGRSVRTCWDGAPGSVCVVFAGEKPVRYRVRASRAKRCGFPRTGS